MSSSTRSGGTRRHAITGLAGLAWLGLAGCATAPAGKGSGMAMTPVAGTAFLHHFEALAEKEDFALIEDFIDERAHFRFNDGDHIGRPAIRAVFEKTWRGDPTVRKACFYLSEVIHHQGPRHAGAGLRGWALPHRERAPEPLSAAALSKPVEPGCRRSGGRVGR